MGLRIHHSLPKIVLRITKSSVEDEEIEIIGTRPAIIRKKISIGRNIEFAQTQRLSDREIGRNLKSCSASISNNDYSGQHDTLYYQTLPLSDYN